MIPDMVPDMIDNGYRLIITVLDVWGFTNLVNGGLEQGRERLHKMAEAKEMVNGKAPSS